MKIMHVRSSSGIYGAENVLLTLLPELAASGIPAKLLCIQNHVTGDRSLFDSARSKGLDAAIVPCGGRFDWKTVSALSAQMSAEPDAVFHTHDYKSLFYVLLARRGRKIPLVTTSHGHFHTNTKQRLYNQLEIMMMRRADHVVIVSESMRQHLQASGLPASDISLIENGIDTSRFRPDAEPLARALFDLTDEDFVFGAAMRLDGQKNPLGLLKAFAEVAQQRPLARLLLAGDGPMRQQMVELADELGITGKVRLVGARKDLLNLYPMLDCFVMPSFFEGLPLALLEAMATAVPVIATAVGHVPVVLEGTPATLIAPGDMAAFAAAMLAQTGQKRREPALRERVLELFSAGRMADKHRQIYQQVAGEPQTTRPAMQGRGG